MKNITVYTLNNSDSEYSLQIWEYYYAYKQFEFFPNEVDIKFKFKKIKNEHNFKPESDDCLTVLVAHLTECERIKHISSLFDVVIISNSFEDISVFSYDALELLENDNTFAMISGTLHKSFRNYKKYISFSGCWVDVIQRFTDAKFFTSYVFDKPKLKNNKEFVFVGGHLRSWRKFIIDTLPKNIKVVQNNKNVVKTKDLVVGSKTDAEFVDYCNTKYINEINDQSHPKKLLYRIRYGLPEYPAGESNIADWTINEFKDYSCVLVCETSFINDVFFPTEKIFKPIMCKNHFIMFSGRNSYSIMMEMGFRSILELVPNGLEFDKIENHVERFKCQMNKIQYLVENTSILYSNEADEIIDHNFNNFIYSKKHIEYSVKQIDNIILDKTNDKEIRRVV